MRIAIDWDGTVITQDRPYADTTTPTCVCHLSSELVAVDDPLDHTPNRPPKAPTIETRIIIVPERELCFFVIVPAIAKDTGSQCDCSHGYCTMMVVCFYQILSLCLNSRKRSRSDQIKKKMHTCKRY